MTVSVDKEIPCPICGCKIREGDLQFAKRTVSNLDIRLAAIRELGAHPDTMFHDLIHVPEDW